MEETTELEKNNNKLEENQEIIEVDKDKIDDSQNADDNNQDSNDDKNKKKASKRKQTFERKNIRNIIDDDNFCQDAKDAQKAEAERLKRVKEKEHSNKMLKLLTNDNLRFGIRAPMGGYKILQNNLTPRFVNQFNIPSNKLFANGLQFRKPNVNKMYRLIPDKQPINLDVSDEDDDDLYPEANLLRTTKQERSFEVIEISDGEEDDEEVDDVLDQEKLDVKNILHDEQGRVLINNSHPVDEEGYYLCDKIGTNIKPHQVSGIRFLYNNLVESKKQFNESEGFGCILAHSMGLGKTVQVIGFLDILFRCVEARSALVIVPINTIQNWQSEMDFWLPVSPTNCTKVSQQSNTENEIESTLEQSNNQSTLLTSTTPVFCPGYRPFNLYVIRDCHKTVESRHNVIKDWLTKGGVLLIGYEMFRLLVTYRKNSSANKNNINNSEHTNNLLDSLNFGARKTKKKDLKSSKKKVCIDIDLEEKRDGYYQDFLKALIDPGPQVVICDEGHRIKNSEASISKALKSIKTHRRVVMTGYPLQNNLTEYWCMVDFVRPNYLGSKHEFNNMFQRPIENGQCVDSTLEDRKLMQGRAHVLHELLEGFVQRRSHAVLKASLPPKWEYVIVVKMSQIQRKLYSTFMNAVINGGPYLWQDTNVLKTYAMCCKIWNHPDILYKISKEQKAELREPDFDFDIEDDSTTTQSQKTNNRPNTRKRLYHPISSSSTSTTATISSTSSLITSASAPQLQEVASTSVLTEKIESSETKEEPMDIMNDDITDEDSKQSFKDIPPDLLQQNPAKFMSFNEYYEAYKQQTEQTQVTSSFSWITDDVWKLETDNYDEKIDINQDEQQQIMRNYKEYETECKENGGKIVIFLSLLEECLKYGDKMLVFSQSLLTLDLLELFLKQSSPGNGLEWVKNKTYFRLDGSTSAPERERMITSFNAQPEAGLFLLSTRAGCLGINLIGANRVIVFDASWNPCHDCQAVCRVYRYGQIKPCFIYRLITDNTIEKKIYDRQVKKQGISDRVVDESNPSQQFTRSQVEVLIEYKDDDIPTLSGDDLEKIQKTCAEEDPVLGRIVTKHSDLITKVPFTHESLLIDQKDYRLTRREKRKAKERYEMDKRQSLYYQRNNYSEYYVKTTVPISDTFSGMNKSLNGIPLRSSILPNFHPIATATPGTPLIAEQSTNDLTQPAYRINRQFTRPQRLIRPHSALMKEIEQARLRCGFQVDSKNSGIQMPTPLNEPVKKTVDLTDQDSEPSNKTRKVDNSGENEKPTSQSLIKNSNADKVLEKEVKIVRITATTEMAIPTTTVTQSEAGASNNSGTPSTNKINVGDDLEIIYSRKGKFLRVVKTGDLFAIKGSNPNPMQSNTQATSKPKRTSEIPQPVSLPKIKSAPIINNSPPKSQTSVQSSIITTTEIPTETATDTISNNNSPIKDPIKNEENKTWESKSESNKAKLSPTSVMYNIPNISENSNKGKENGVPLLNGTDKQDLTPQITSINSQNPISTPISIETPNVSVSLTPQIPQNINSLLTMSQIQQCNPVVTTTNNSSNTPSNLICCACKYSGPMMYIPGCNCTCHSNHSVSSQPQHIQQYPTTHFFNPQSAPQMYATLHPNYATTLAQQTPYYTQQIPQHTYIMNGVPTTYPQTIYAPTPFPVSNGTVLPQMVLPSPQQPQHLLLNNGIATSLSNGTDDKSNHFKGGYQFADL